MPLSDEEMALIEAIHAAPKSNHPRLAYADWCESHNLAELAEFIRLMCREPYPILENGRKPKIDVMTWELKHEDPARCSRLVELLGGIFDSERFPQTLLRDEYYRGLPLYEYEISDGWQDTTIIHLTKSPLTRFRLFLNTREVSSWLEHSLLYYVDNLRIYPISALHDSAEDDEDDEGPCLTGDDLRALIASPMMDRLEELGLCGHLTPEAEMLVAELGKRVPINFSY